MFFRNALVAALVIGAIFTVIVGSLWHNWYPWSGENHLIGYFAPVNESVWEHMKLIIFPLLLFSGVIWVLFSKLLRNPFTALLFSTLAAIAVVIFWFYLYETIDGKSNLFADIMLYVISIVVAVLVMFYILTARRLNPGIEVASLLGYLILVSLTLVWGYDPPCECGVWEAP